MKQSHLDEIKTLVPFQSIDEGNHLLNKGSKRNILMESTPRGNVIVYFDNEDDCFKYYCDYFIPFLLLDAVIQKYVIIFKCPLSYSSSSCKSIDDEFDASLKSSYGMKIRNSNNDNEINNNSNTNKSSKTKTINKDICKFKKIFETEKQRKIGIEKFQKRY